MSILSFQLSLSHVLERIFHPERDIEGERTRLHQLHDECDVCPGVVQPEQSDNLHLSKGSHRQLHLIGLVKPRELSSALEQITMLDNYCQKFGHKIVRIFDCSAESTPLAIREALDALQHADGLIVTDIFRIVEHPEDPLRDLTPMIHDQFFHKGKRLISIKEDIDTGTPEGQQAVIEFLKLLTDASYHTC